MAGKQSGSYLALTMEKTMQWTQGILPTRHCKKYLLLSLCLSTLYMCPIMVSIYTISQYSSTPSTYKRQIMEQAIQESSMLETLRNNMDKITDSGKFANCRVSFQPRISELQLVVNVTGNIECAKEVTSKALGIVRESQLVLISQYKDIKHEYFHPERAYPKGDQAYFGTVSKYPQILTVLIAWHSYNELNWAETDLPVKQYYKRDYPKATCNLESTAPQECQDNLNSSKLFETKTADVIALSSREMPGVNNFPFYVHVIHNAHIDHYGRVSTGPLDIIPYTCKAWHSASRRNMWIRVIFPWLPNILEYDEVFVINQVWGSGVFHSAIEALPRLAPYLQFLRENPNIWILAGKAHPQFELLGIDSNRIIQGPVKARVVYLPQGGGCGLLNPAPGQILAAEYSAFISKTFPGNLLQRNSLVLIKRTTKRYLKQHDEIARILQKLASKYGLQYELFPDNPVPSFDTTMQMFHRARLVVGPHGAGLANLMYSRPRTGVLEVLCNPEMNYCYQGVAKNLGHIYLGLLSTKPRNCGPLYVNIEYFKQAAENFLKKLIQHQDSI